MNNCNSSLVILLFIILNSVACAQEKTELPAIDIDVRLNSAAAVMAWEVRLSATGLADFADGLELRLENWGEWDRADSLFLRNFSSNLKFEKVDNKLTRIKINPPENWDGVLEVNYKILMTNRNSNARDNFGLMPWYGDNYGHGFTSNTLMDVFHNESAIDVVRSVKFVAESNATIVSGWGELSRGTQSVQLKHPINNTLVVFGSPTEVATDNIGGVEYEIIQFGVGKPIARDLKGKVAELVASYSKSSGLPLKLPVKIYLTDTFGGGVNVDGAMNVGYNPEHGLEFDLLMTTAHELYHEWLGGGFVPVVNPESVWFQEGFTDYLALWHLAHLGHISRQQFVDRLQKLYEVAQSSSSFRKISFGDSEVDWRDNDGPNETMAYRGAALLAFYTDVELRRQGKTGLNQMISDLHELGKPVNNEDIRNWCYDNGLQSFHETYIAKPNFRELIPELVSIGCERTRVEVVVPYAGIQNDNSGLFGKIVDLDPEGAAAKAGIKVGDQISGFWPLDSRDDVQVDKEKVPKFSYGLTKFQLDETIHFGVIRDDENRTIDIKPVHKTGVAFRHGVAVSDESKFDVFVERSSR